MNAPVIIGLDGEPRGKERPRFRRSGAAYTPAQTRSFETALKYKALEAMRGRPPMEGAIRVTVIARFSVPANWSTKRRLDALSGDVRHTSKPDVDNLLKSLDALNKVVFRDDAQIIEATVTKRYARSPGLYIEVTAA